MAMPYMRLSGLSRDATEADLHRLCGSFGRVHRFEMQRGGSATVRFAYGEDAQKAVRALDGYDFMGRHLRADLVRNQDLYTPPGAPLPPAAPPPSSQTCFRCHQPGHVVRNCPSIRDDRRSFSTRPPRRFGQRDLYPEEPSTVREHRHTPERKPYEHTSFGRREPHERSPMRPERENERDMSITVISSRYDTHDMDEDEDSERDFRRAFHNDDDDSERRGAWRRYSEDRAADPRPVEHKREVREVRSNSRIAERERDARVERSEPRSERTREPERKLERESERQARDQPKRSEPEARSEPDHRRSEAVERREAERTREIVRQEDRDKRLTEDKQRDSYNKDGNRRDLHRIEDRGRKRKDRSPSPQQRSERREQSYVSIQPSVPSGNESRGGSRSVVIEERGRDNGHDIKNISVSITVNDRPATVDNGDDDDDDLHAVPASPEDLSPLRDEIQQASTPAGELSERELSARDGPNLSEVREVEPQPEDRKATHSRHDSRRRGGRHDHEARTDNESGRGRSDRHRPSDESWQSGRMPERRRERRRSDRDERRRR